jgi:hypothetical protein
MDLPQCIDTVDPWLPKRSKLVGQMDYTGQYVVGVADVNDVNVRFHETIAYQKQLP